MKDKNVSNDTDSIAIIHQRQSLKLCGVQTVNNLLQLPADLGNEDIGFCQCGSMIIQRRGDERTHATKKEFDRIADELTVYENDLLRCNNSSPAIGEGREVSFLESFTSNHRTIVFGNYSYEVLEIALKNRNVQLARCLVNESTSNFCIDESSDNAILVGFVVNIRGDSSSSLVNYARRWIPGFNSFFSGNHWYAITRLRSVRNPESCSIQEKIPWTIIDGLYETLELKEDADLEAYLTEVANQGGSIFQASLQNRE